MSLAELQQEFMGHVLADDRSMPAGWSPRMAAGLDVYRNAYRVRLVDALRETFPRTVRWVGEEPFRAAAAHYLISEPPDGWTLDGIGEGFVPVLATLFARDAEVAELAWLEWAMHCAFTASDAPALSLAEFAAATAGFGEAEWTALRLCFVSGLQLRTVRTDCVSLWRQLADGRPKAAPEAEHGTACIVWREDWAPVCRLFPAAEAEALQGMRGGADFGTLCARLMESEGAEVAAAEAGAMLRRWLDLGLVCALAMRSPEAS